MKKNTIFITLILAVLILQSCNKEFIRPSGAVTTEEHIFTDFTGLDISDDFKAYVSFSESEERITIEADDNLHEHIIVGMNGNTLEIRMKDHVSINGNETLNARISTRALNWIEGSGDCEIFLEDQLATENVSIKLTGDSYLEGEIRTDNLEVELKGDSNMDVLGSSEMLRATLKGDSKIENFGFMVGILDADLSGDSEAYLTVVESMVVKASGDSQLFYKGDAVIISQDLSGDSEIVKVD